MKVKLPYGKESLILDLPDDQVQIIEPKELEETSTTSETLENALEKPLAGSKLRWFLLILIFILGLAGMEVYKHMELIRNSYTVQRLQSKIKNVEKENAVLKRKISTSLSLRRLEVYARERLKLGEPEEVRFIRKDSPRD
ncbi:unnamed protein product [marine sediment metagenome]|uniref:Cell division protein FtsL n=2 Tax=root TaxID=1 RepID=X1L783_9ZZZZ